MRRLDYFNVPLFSRLNPSSTVVILGLPMSRPTKDGVRQILQHFGDLQRVMIIRPGNPVPECVKPYLDNLDISFQTELTVVEFENDTEAIRAVDCINKNNIKIFLLGDATPDAKLLT